MLLLLAVALLAQLAGRLQIPYPVFLVGGGLAIALVPGIPRIDLQPGVVFLVFLPPLLYAAAFTSSARDLWTHAGRISLLAIALVALTVVVVAALARVVLPELSWPMAFVLGAVLAPTDPVAATAGFRRTPVPERVRIVVEGEALVNDGVGLTLYRVAVGAATAGTFALGSAALQLVLVAAGASPSAWRSGGRSTTSSAACRRPRSRSRCRCSRRTRRTSPPRRPARRACSRP